MVYISSNSQIKILLIRHRCHTQDHSEYAAFNFYTKKVSAYGVDNEIVEEIQKFSYPIQKLLIKEACAVMNRIENGKSAPDLTSLDCDCLFINCHVNTFSINICMGLLSY